MASFIESLVAGGQKWGEFAKGVETARTAPETAQAELLQQQSQAELLKQQAELGKYDIEAAKRISQVATPVGPTQDYSAIYSQSTSMQQKLNLAKQKLAKAEELKNQTMASGKFSETTRKAYEDAQSELKDLEKDYKGFQVESLRKVLEPALLAKDQNSWDSAKPQLANAAAEAAVQEAMKQGVPEENLARLRTDVRNQTLSQLPKTWGPSAQNFVKSKAAELSGLKTAYDIDEQRRKEEKHEADLLKLRAETQKARAEADKAVRETKEGNPKAIQDRVKELRQLVNTESLELNRMTDDEERNAKERLDAAKEAQGSWFGNKTEEDAEYKAAETAYNDIQKRKAIAQKLIEKAQQELELSLGIAKEKGITTPPEEPKSNIKMSDYSVTPELATQGYTPENVLTELAKANPGFTNEQYVQIAIEKGYFPKGSAKVVPKMEPEVTKASVKTPSSTKVSDSAIAEDPFTSEVPPFKRAEVISPYEEVDIPNPLGGIGRTIGTKLFEKGQKKQAREQAKLQAVSKLKAAGWHFYNNKYWTPDWSKSYKFAEDAVETL